MDVDDMARFLNERARREQLDNLLCVLAAPDNPRLPEPVDLALIVDTYHHIGERPAYFARLKGRLKEGGRVAIIDFKKGQPLGPPDEHKLEPEQVVAEMSSAGFRLLERLDTLPNQYFLVFAP